MDNLLADNLLADNLLNGVILRDVSFAYGERRVFDGLTLEILPPGISQIIALAAPSGCGKTTLLRLLAGLEEPSGGEIICPAAGEIALMFQENRLLPGLSCAEQLAAVLPAGVDVLPYLAMVDLAGELHSLPRELSGGMQRRLALARALAYARDKALLLLDEPFAGVDLPRAQGIMQQIRTLRLPVIYTAHDEAVLALADRVIRGWADGC